MPRNPAASQIGTPRCISQVAAVWRKVCGVTWPGQTGEPHGRFEPLPNRGNRLAVELNKAVGDQLAILPATQVGKQSRRYRRRRLTFLSGPPADRLAVKDASLKIDK